MRCVIRYSCEEWGGIEKSLFISRYFSYSGYYKSSLAKVVDRQFNITIVRTTTRVELGVNGNIFDLQYSCYKDCLLTESWIQHTWKFASEYGVEIHPKVEEINLRRRGDVSIMQTVIESNLLSANELKWFNRCRLYLRVATLADITSPNGKVLRKDCLDGIRQAFYRQLGWPNWEKPPLYAWTVWRKTLRLVFTDGLTPVLKQQLGQWYELNTQEWEWFLTRDNNTLWKREGNCWKKFK